MITQRPMELDISLIDEDPLQPRSEFNQELLQEMAKTIHSRGVKNPISVHKHPTEPGRYVINDGARRFRASKLVGKKTITAFVDSNFTKIDQIIVNAHHETFSAREWAKIIEKEQQKGKKNHEIAEQLGKSRPFITHHSKLLTLPEPLADIFNSGRCTNATALYELSLMWKSDRKEVEEWLHDSARDITRGSVKELRDFLSTKSALFDEKVVNYDKEEGGVSEEDHKIAHAASGIKKPIAQKLRRVIVLVEHDGRKARLLQTRSLSEDGLAWFKYEDDGIEFQSALNQVKAIALIAD